MISEALGSGVCGSKGCLAWSPHLCPTEPRPWNPSQGPAEKATAAQGSSPYLARKFPLNKCSSLSDVCSLAASASDWGKNQGVLWPHGFGMLSAETGPADTQEEGRLQWPRRWWLMAWSQGIRMKHQAHCTDGETTAQ